MQCWRHPAWQRAFLTKLPEFSVLRQTEGLPIGSDPRPGLLPDPLGGVPPTCFQNLPRQRLPLLGAAHSPSSCFESRTPSRGA